MNVRLRLLKTSLHTIHDDLSRPHAFAAERVGFLSCSAAHLHDGNLLLVGEQWHAVDDEDYVDEPRVGACIGPAAFRKVLQSAYREPASILHVHRHEHRGIPRFSPIDERSMREFVPGFFNACRSHPHGALVLSHDSAAGAMWISPGTSPVELKRFELIGNPPERWETV